MAFGECDERSDFFGDCDGRIVFLGDVMREYVNDRTDFWECDERCGFFVFVCA